MQRAFILFLALAPICAALGQKKVLTYPFQFEKSFLAKGDYDAYFLDNPSDSAFSIILKDNKKVEYVWLSKDFKVLSKVPSPIGNTVLDQSANHYIGGTASGSEFHFLYHAKSSYLMETVDFSAKTVGNKKILEFPDGEKSLIALGNDDTYYILATNDKSGELVLYSVSNTGQLSSKHIPFTVPAVEGKRKGKLSNYLSGIKVVKGGEEPDLSSAVQSAKIFSQHGYLHIVVNDGDNPTHIFSIDLSNLTAHEKFVDYNSLISKDDKGKVYVSSFLRGDDLYSLILNKKNIRISVHHLPTGSLLAKYEFTEDAGSNLFAESPVTEKRMGKKVDMKDVDDIRKLIKAFTKGTEGLMVSQTESGKLVLTAGTYDLIQLSSGGGGGGWVGGWQQSSMPVTPGIVNHGATYTAVSTWNPNMYYRPGMPSYTTTSARYYTTTYFRLLLDSTSLKTVKGRVPTPVADQIKDYIDEVDKRARATNQFHIGKNQYYGYYDRDVQAYVIEQIRLFNR